MSENTAPVAPKTSKLADGATAEHDATGTITRIVSPKGKVYAPKNLSAKANAELVKRVEDYRWSEQLTVAEFVLVAVTALLDSEESAKA